MRVMYGFIVLTTQQAINMHILETPSTFQKWRGNPRKSPIRSLIIYHLLRWLRITHLWPSKFGLFSFRILSFFSGLILGLIRL